MNTNSSAPDPGSKAPWHLWAVGILALLWNAAGAWTIFMAQAGRLSGLTDDEAAYYAAQPAWFVLVTDIALLGAVFGAIALLARHRSAVWLFGVSLVAILITDACDLIAGTSRMLVTVAAMVATICIVIIAVLELIYARAMRSRKVLR